MADDVRGRVFSTAEVALVSGASYRQVDYWSRTHRLRPVVEARGSGSSRRFDFAGLVQAVLMREWARRGWPSAWAVPQGRHDVVAPGLQVDVQFDRSEFEFFVERLVKERLV